MQRNLGVAFGYHTIAVKALEMGLERVDVDRKVITRELSDNPEVIAEAIQTVLRKNGVKGGYEKLKKLTRGEKVTQDKLYKFISDLPLPKSDIDRLVKLSEKMK